jgi:hypothetical protein
MPENTHRPGARLRGDESGISAVVCRAGVRKSSPYGPEYARPASFTRQPKRCTADFVGTIFFHENQRRKAAAASAVSARVSCVVHARCRPGADQLASRTR